MIRWEWLWYWRSNFLWGVFNFFFATSIIGTSLFPTWGKSSWASCAGSKVASVINQLVTVMKEGLKATSPCPKQEWHWALSWGLEQFISRLVAIFFLLLFFSFSSQFSQSVKVGIFLLHSSHHSGSIPSLSFPYSDPSSHQNLSSYW